jgi:hypothetical protein
MSTSSLGSVESIASVLDERQQPLDSVVATSHPNHVRPHMKYTVTMIPSANDAMLPTGCTGSDDDKRPTCLAADETILVLVRKR